MDGRPTTVAAIVVAHDGAAWLPKALTSLSAMEVAPTAWHAVDVSSTDVSADYLRQSFGAGRLSFAPAGTGFGDAVRIALDALPQTDWIWLLHDDAIVTPTTLAGLLNEATSADDIAVVGPKVREWPSLKRLLEVGVTVTGTGWRVTGLETGEPDAGQYDRPRTVLAVSSAGMLVRRSVWDELGGFDSTLPLYFDDIDFGWRVSRAGYRVRTAPLGVIFHAEASARHRRPKSAGDVPTWEHRRAAIYTVLANTGRRRFLWQYLRMFVGSLIRVLGFLVDRDPESVGDELLAVRDVYGRPGVVRSARRARAPGARRSEKEIRALLPSWWLPYRHGLDVLVEAVTAAIKPESLETTGRRSILVERSPDDDLDLAAGPSLVARRPWLSTVLALLVGSVVAGWGLFGSGVHGLALPPPPHTTAGWWSLVFERQHDVGLGSTAFAPPYALLLAFAGTLLWWWPGALITVLLLFAVPLAVLSAHRLGRRFIDDPRLCGVWALTYGLIVFGTGAVSQGRLGTVVALAVAPIIVSTLIQLVREPGWQVGLRLGIWTAVAASFAPVSFWLSAAAALVALSQADRRARRPVFLAAVVAVILLGPWLAQRVVLPGRVWWEAGFAAPGHASMLDVVMGRGGGAGAAPVGFTALVVLLAVAAIFAPGSRTTVRYAWTAGAISLGFAIYGLAMPYSTPAGGSGISAWVGLPAALWLAALSTAVVAAIPHWHTWFPKPVATGLTVAAAVVPVLLGGWWLGHGDDPLRVGRTDAVPAYLVERPGDTLVVTGSVAHGVDVRAVSGAGPTLGQEALARHTAVAAAAVRDLFSSPYGDGVGRLAAAGVDAIYAPAVDREVAARLDAVPSFAPAGADRPGSRVWTIESPGPTDPRPVAGRWRWGLGSGQVLAWVVAVVLTAPLRKREQPGEIDDDMPFDGVIGPVAQ